MNDETQTQADARLHRLMTTVIGPDALSDEEIESLLNSSEPPFALSEEQTQRIAGKVNRLLDAAAKTSARGSGPMLPVDQRPRLVSATTHEPPRPIRIPAVVALLASMLALVSVIVLTPETPSQSRTAAHLPESPGFCGRPGLRYWMTAKPLPDAVPAAKVAVGDEIATGDLERRRVTLPDGSVLYVNSGSQVKMATERRVEVTRGEVFVEVVPVFDRASHGTQSSCHSLSDEAADPATPAIVTQRVTATLPFEVVTPNRTVTALGTKFSVSVDDAETDVMVTQGKVKVSGVDEVVAAGQQVKASGTYTFASAPQASTALEWTRDLMAAATGPLVPKSEFSGGALVTVDPNGQSSRLSLRNYHIDVHIEDGFARTTIDQTYFNHTHSRLEGTFHFPLPTDASLSRLAMYVNGKLMEGGMAERDHARNTFEEIKRKMLDPALLEWVDGSTFKMRVFPLEPRQEKRIVLSYSQRLNSAEGQLQYRFPAGHTMDAVRDWSAHVRIRGGAGCEWHSQSHTMTAVEDEGDLLLDAALKNVLMDRDFVLKVADNSNLKSQISNFKSEGQQYLMLRLRPELPGEIQRQPHHWVFLFEHGGDRSPLLARAQIEILRTLLENAEHTDTFSIVSASTRAELYPAERQLCTAENTAAAVKHLENIHLVGALDLAAAFRKCAEEIALPHLPDNGLVPRSKILVHLGSGLPALGERDASKLAAMLPGEAQYVGIGVGRRWNQAMMKLAASRTGGLSTQINPDEEIAWRAFEVFSKLHSPRLVDLAVKGEERGERTENLKSESPEFLLFSDTITQGEELAAICRVPEGHPLPASVTVTATLNGNPWTQTIQVGNVKDQATYLPRHWAKMEIDRLLADNAEQHREAIVALSKSMYVMSPFTSLLVLENEEMYTQFNIDRGRKDHWALYPCPEQIDVAVENTEEDAAKEVVTAGGPKSPADVMSTIARIQRPQWFTWNFPQMVLGDGSLNHWGTTQQQGNMWFEANADMDWLDPDDDYDGIPESIWNESSTAPRVFFDMNLHGNADWHFRRNLGRDESVLFGNRLDEEQLNSDEARYIRDISVQDVNQWGKPAEQAGRSLNERMDVDFNVQDTSLITELFEDRLSFQTQDPGRPALAMPIPRRASGLWSDRERVSSAQTDRPLDHEFWKVGSWASDSSDPGMNLRSRVNAKQMQDLGVLFLKGNEADVAKAEEMIEILERESLADMRLPALLFEDDMSLAERPSSGLSGAIELRRFGLPTLGSGPGTADGFFFRPAEPAGEEVRGRFRTENLSRGGFRLVSPEQQEVRITHQNSPGSHRWSADSVVAVTELVTLPTFQTPSPHSLGVNAILFGDLISHASGLNTSPADVMAVVEEESGERRAESRDGQPAISNLKSQISNPPVGRVDDAARALIEKSRSRGWESITLPGREGEAGITIHYDGSGRHVWERVVSEGLREHVVCDGSNLWHVYREIGLASKRPFSRFHHRKFTAIVPWLLPSADELARGADVVAVDERTVAIMPVTGTALAVGEAKSREPESGKPSTGSNNSKSEIADSQSGEQSPATSAVPLTLHLVFAPDGRLAERRIVEQASGKIRHRVTYDADGTVRIVDSDGKELSSLNLHRSTAAAPQLVPDLNGLVVLPMPVRTPEVVVAKQTAAKATADLSQVGLLDADLSEDDAVSLMLAYMANGNGARMVEIARKRFIDKGDTRDGIYVLLSRFPQALVQAAIPETATGNGESQSTPGLTPPGSPGFDLRPPVEGSPLKQFVRQYMNWLRDGDHANEFRIDAPEGSFLQRMATARNLHVRWLTDAATKDLTQDQVQQEVDRTLEFIESCRTLDMGWSLMSVMRPRLNTPGFLAAYSKAAERFEQHPQIGLLVRRERMTALFAADKHDEGRSLFKEWLLAHLEQGFVPPIGTELYHACISGDGQKQIDELLLESAKQLVNAQMQMTLHSMSVQMRELGNTNIADQMMTLLLASLDAKERPDVSLYAIEQLRRMKDSRADRLLDQVMELPMADQVPGLWRFASKLAEDSGRKRLAAERLERAIQLEFATRPTVINIQTVRSDYTDLLAKYEELLTASTTLELAPPADLAARIIQTADQWRTLDEDDTVACQTASRLLAKLNSKELAWDYLTTPLAENSGESAPWIALARSLGTETQTDLADMAWTQAFEQESTNPEILLEHARMLQTAGRVAPAKVLLKLAVDGTWQPRFASAVQQCRELLGAL